MMTAFLDLSAPDSIMNDTAAKFLRWVECLLDPSRTPFDQLRASQEWHAWGVSMLGVDERTRSNSDPALLTNTSLPTGNAISPLDAALCVREYRRTAVFLQAMDAAISAAIERFPGEAIHVLEAGCGPLAPLALAMAMRYPADRVSFTLVDVHTAALDGARRIVETLGLTESVRAYIAADVTQVRFAPEHRPHIVASEVLLRALTREPQVAATLNLAPQLRSGGFFLPECIDVDAALFDSAAYFRQGTDLEDLDSIRKAAIKELGNVFRLEASAIDRLPAAKDGQIPAGTAAIPPHDPQRWELQLFTRIRVFREHVLTDFESSLNQPKRVPLPRSVAQNGGVASFVYEMSSDPGLRLIG